MVFSEEARALMLVVAARHSSERLLSSAHSMNGSGHLGREFRKFTPQGSTVIRFGGGQSSKKSVRAPASRAASMNTRLEPFKPFQAIEQVSCSLENSARRCTVSKAAEALRLLRCGLKVSSSLFQMQPHPVLSSRDSLRSGGEQSDQRISPRGDRVRSTLLRFDFR